MKLLKYEITLSRVSKTLEYKKDLRIVKYYINTYELKEDLLKMQKRAEKMGFKLSKNYYNSIILKKSNGERYFIDYRKRVK